MLAQLSLPSTVHTSTPIKQVNGLPSIRVSAPGSGSREGSTHTIYEELKSKDGQPMLGRKSQSYLILFNLFNCLDLEDAEGYDHLDFRRPVNELRPQYLSTESIKTSSHRSRNSSHQSKASGDLRAGDASNKSDQSDSSGLDWTDSVLNSLEKLNNSSLSRTRKCIYKPESVTDLNPVNL